MIHVKRIQISDYDHPSSLSENAFHIKKQQRKSKVEHMVSVGGENKQELREVEVAEVTGQSFRKERAI